MPLPAGYQKEFEDNDMQAYIPLDAVPALTDRKYRAVHALHEDEQ